VPVRGWTDTAARLPFTHAILRIILSAHSPVSPVTLRVGAVSAQAPDRHGACAGSYDAWCALMRESVCAVHIATGLQGDVNEEEAGAVDTGVPSYEVSGCSIM